MNAKEEAKELVDKFSALENNVNDYDYDKLCALICIDQILELYLKNWNIENQHLQEVKTEIQKL